MLKILMISPDYVDNLFGGIGIYVDELISELISKYRVDVTLLVVRIGRNREDICDEKIVVNERFRYQIVAVNNKLKYEEMVSFGEEKKNNPYAPLRLAYTNYVLGEKVEELLNNNKFDLVHIHDAYFAEVAYMIKQLRKLPLICTIHSMTANNKKIMFHLRMFLIENSDYVITVCKWMEEKIKQQFRAVHLNLETVEPERNLEIKVPRNFESYEEKTILFVGRLEPTKGCMLLLEAYANVCLKQEKIKLKFIGSGTLIEDLLESAKQKGLKNVFFHEFIENKLVLQEMNQAYVLVVPSIDEPFGLVALEGIYSGTCILTSDAGGLKYIHERYQSGSVFKQGDSKDLAEKLEQLLNNVQLRNELCKQDKLSCELSLGDRMCSIYNKVLQNDLL